MLIAVAALSTCVAAGGAAGSKSYRFDDVAGLTQGQHGGVYFLAGSGDGRDEGLFFVSSATAPRKIRLSEVTDARSIGRGGDGRIWVATLSEGTWVPRVRLVDGRKQVRTIRLPRTADVTSIAPGPRGVTWISSVDSKHFGYFDRGYHLHRVRVPRASTYYGLAVDRKGVAWASNGDGLLRISPQGRIKHIPVNPQENAAIAIQDGFVWLTARGAIQKITATGDVTSLPIQHPFWEPPGGYAYFRSPMELVPRPDGGIGFLAASLISDRAQDYYTAGSLGVIRPDGILTEQEDFFEYPSSATYDRAGNFWYGTTYAGLNFVPRSAGTM